MYSWIKHTFFFCTKLIYNYKIRSETASDPPLRYIFFTPARGGFSERNGVEKRGLDGGGEESTEKAWKKKLIRLFRHILTFTSEPTRTYHHFMSLNAHKCEIYFVIWVKIYSVIFSGSYFLSKRKYDRAFCCRKIPSPTFVRLYEQQKRRNFPHSLRIS